MQTHTRCSHTQQLNKKNIQEFRFRYKNIVVYGEKTEQKNIRWFKKLCADKWIICFAFEHSQVTKC